MSATDRLATLDSLPTVELCHQAETALGALVDVMNHETILLRAGHIRQAGALTPEKTRLAQDYISFARSVQRQNERLHREAPELLERLRLGHESLATQMAENLRVLATARNVTEDILGDAARTVGQQNKVRAYGRNGSVPAEPAPPARGIAINRAL